MPISGPSHFSPLNRRGGRSVDSDYNRFMSKTRKDPRDLELTLKKFYFLDAEEEQSPESIQRILPAGEIGKASELTPEEDVAEKETDSITDKLDSQEDEYFNLNDKEKMIYFATAGQPDYKIARYKPRISTAGLGTGRLSARQRFLSGPYNNSYPGGNIKEQFRKELQKLIRYEIINYDES